MLPHLRRGGVRSPYRIPVFCISDMNRPDLRSEELHGMRITVVVERGIIDVWTGCCTAVGRVCQYGRRL